MANKKWMTVEIPDFNISIPPRDIEYSVLNKEQFVIAYFNTIEDYYDPIDPLLNGNTRVYVYANFVDVINPGGTIPELGNVSPDTLKSGRNWMLLETTKFPLVDKNNNGILLPQYVISINVTKYKGNFQIAFYARNNVS